MSWDDLSMREKAAMMRVAVKNKIFDIGQIKEQYNKFSEGGYIYSTPEEKALLKANNLVEPASNYSEATDMSISSLREWITDIVQRTIPECPTGLSNCTLTASQFYGKPIGRAATIVSNPEANNFYQVSEDYAIPGTMVIASSPEGTPNPVYHTMILSGYADKDYPFEYNGIHYDIKKGDPLVHYSKGKNSADNYKKNIPLKVYTDQSHGKTLNRYYRPFDENNLPNVLLPELVVLPTNNQAQQNNVNMYEDGGPQNISFYELANDPQYGYHLIDDGKNGQPTYYNANTGQWFLANKAQDEGRLSEIKSGDTFTPIIANPVPEQPAVSNYISSQISNMQRPLTEEQAWDKQLEKAKETFSYFPGIGEAIDVYDAGTEALKGNYEAAVAGLGLMFLPEWAEKGVRKGGKYIWNWLNRKTDVVEKAMGLAGYKKLYHGTHNGEFELPEFRSSENNFGIHMSSNRHVSEKFTDSKSPIIKEAYVKTSNAPMVLDMHANDYNMFNPRYSVFNPYVVKDNKYIEKLDFYPDRGTTTEMYYKTLYPEYTHKKRSSNLPFADYHVEIPVGTEVRTMNMQELNWPNMSNEAKIQWQEIHNKVQSGQITKSEANDAIAKMLSGNKIPVLKYRNSVPGEQMASNQIDYIITDPNAFKLNMPRLEIPNWMLLGIGASTAGAVYGAHKLTEDDD